MALQEEFEKQGLWLFKYRSFLPLIMLLIGCILYIRTELYPETFFLEETPYEDYYEFGCLVVGLIGLAIRIFTVGYSAKNTSGRNVKEQVADTLNTTGIYSLVRHPLYLGNFFMWLGPAMLTGNFGFILVFCMFYWIYYERIMFAEEQFLRSKFGNSYMEWAKGVPAFIPSLKNYTSPKYNFSWKKIIKKEKNGLFALFLIFCTFDITGELIEHKNHYNYFLITACILTGISYIVVKFIRKNTALLNEDDR
ncbi:MAG: DUF1295 domain-containing protein [Bacteroidia bacterium]|nr:DUF1295 domain-containing protein [Bacteroidia bacterium]